MSSYVIWGASCTSSCCHSFSGDDKPLQLFLNLFGRLCVDFPLAFSFGHWGSASGILCVLLLLASLTWVCEFVVSMCRKLLQVGYLLQEESFLVNSVPRDIADWSGNAFLNLRLRSPSVDLESLQTARHAPIQSFCQSSRCGRYSNWRACWLSSPHGSGVSLCLIRCPRASSKFLCFAKFLPYHRAYVPSCN